jgi:hypothetical protein
VGQRDKFRAYIGEGEREVNRVTTLDHATFSIISRAYRVHARDLFAIDRECSDPLMTPSRSVP